MTTEQAIRVLTDLQAITLNEFCKKPAEKLLRQNEALTKAIESLKHSKANHTDTTPYWELVKDEIEKRCGQ